MLRFHMYCLHGLVAPPELRSILISADGSAPFAKSPPRAGFLLVRQAWRVARKRNQFGCGGHTGDLEVKVFYIPGKGKC